MIGTYRNVERSGKRRVTRLSTIVRKIPGIRAIDVDLITYCPRCLHPMAFCEVKKVLVGDREWQQMRLHAKHWGNNCIALLVIEPDLGEIGVKVYASADNTIRDVVWGGESYLTYVLNQAKEIHDCENDRRGRQQVLRGMASRSADRNNGVLG